MALSRWTPRNTYNLAKEFFVINAATITALPVLQIFDRDNMHWGVIIAYLVTANVMMVILTCMQRKHGENKKGEVAGNWCVVITFMAVTIGFILPTFELFPSVFPQSTFVQWGITLIGALVLAICASRIPDLDLEAPGVKRTELAEG